MPRATIEMGMNYLRPRIFTTTTSASRLHTVPLHEFDEEEHEFSALLSALSISRAAT